MTEELPGGRGEGQLNDILKRLAEASQDEADSFHLDDVYHINAEAFPHVAEAAERISKELQILDAQARIVEATAVASSVLWPNAHQDQDVHLLDPRLEQYRSAINPELYTKSYSDLAEALKTARQSYLQTFWTETSTGLIVPSLEEAQMGFMKDFIASTLEDPGKFHNSMTEFVLPMFAGMTMKQKPQAAETYLALRKAVEANAVGWVVDQFSVRDHSPTQMKNMIGWDNSELDLLPTVDPFDGYDDETLIAYPYVSFIPRIVGGRKGGIAVTELGSRRPIPR